MQLSPRRRWVALIVASLALAPATARGHAIIIVATPAFEAVLSGPTLPVMLRFNSRIDQQRSRLILIGPDSAARPVPLVASANPDTLAAKIEDLVPGRYRLRWQVLAIDGHITRGDIPFTIVP
jgi:copper resistance protein C